MITGTSQDSLGLRLEILGIVPNQVAYGGIGRRDEPSVLLLSPLKIGRSADDVLRAMGITSQRGAITE